MLKKLRQKTSVLAIGSGTALIALVGLVGFSPKILEKIETWQQKTEIALQEDDNSPSVVLKLANASAQDRLEQLKTIALSEKPSLERSRARYILATELIKKYEGGPALRFLEGLEQEYPTLAPWILLKQGRGYELSNENDLAQETWKKLIQTYPSDPVVAEALYYLGKYDPKYWDQAISQFPNHPRTWEIINKRLKDNPKQPKLMLLLVKYNAFDPSMNAVRDRLVKDYAPELTPQDWEVIGNGYWEFGDYRKATQAYYKASRTPVNLYRYARGLHLSGQKAQAKQAYQQLVRSFPDAPETGEALMRLVGLSGSSEALGYLDYAINKFPLQAPDALLKRAELLDLLNSKQAASKARQQLLVQYPNSEAAAGYRWKIAKSYADKGDLVKAWEWAQPITINAPDTTVAAKAGFWVGKWAQKLNRPQDAKDAFLHTLARYPQSYYAWRSAVQLGWKVGDFEDVRYYAPTVVFPETRPVLPSGSQAFKELYRLGLDDEAWTLFQAEVPNPWQLTVDEQFALGIFKQKQQQFLEGINLVWDLRNRDSAAEQAQWQVLRNKPEYWQALFPFPYYDLIEGWSQQRSLNPLLVTSLIRQESRFEKEILSPVGAVGLMQVMPSTGRWIADKANITKYSLKNPDDNIKMGTWYLDYTHKEYGNNSMLAVASYNAGPGNVNQWQKKFGLSDPDVFVEKIPFKETRGYVESVFGNYWNYLRIYNAEVAQMMSNLPQQ
ncbi:transglycosylase SLT domain-containing protein [Gloeothece verrucosa]|uniref:Lytic transglycosylase catalytic n=1 Tax=Gloeothece verrucosa (strain PCC 7822) TaxID=497965 RepID=E0UEK1_GLOV7|nr:transglycosylase SLT domain-containing protein [Gloeothece verrucosa]ADN16569.1 Lytic transglycosylase catalytic [Gloeothece verrucosa PCC 7822]